MVLIKRDCMINVRPLISKNILNNSQSSDNNILGIESMAKNYQSYCLASF